MSVVKVPSSVESVGIAEYVRVPDTTVTINRTGDVVWKGKPIGRVRKGFRTYPPPVSKGSRIVRYHKEVPEWHGWLPEQVLGRYRFFADTRQDVLRKLVAHAIAGADA